MTQHLTEHDLRNIEDCINVQIIRVQKTHALMPDTKADYLHDLQGTRIKIMAMLMELEEPHNVVD